MRYALDADAGTAGPVTLHTVANALQGTAILTYGEASGLESGQTRAKE